MSTTNEFVGKKKQILCPIESGGKTRWQKMGIGFVNKDLSINVHLDGVPLNGKLQIRDWEDEETYQRRKKDRAAGRNVVESPAVSEDLPF